MGGPRGALVGAAAGNLVDMGSKLFKKKKKSGKEDPTDTKGKIV